MKTINKAVEFDWDEGNIDKNWLKHKVTDRESEEPFFDQNRIIFRDKVHSQKEERLRILGKTSINRLLFVVFTKRGKKIRINSARDTNRKEALLYEKKTSSAKI